MYEGDFGCQRKLFDVLALVPDCGIRCSPTNGEVATRKRYFAAVHFAGANNGVGGFQALDAITLPGGCTGERAYLLECAPI